MKFIYFKFFVISIIISSLLTQYTLTIKIKTKEKKFQEHSTWFGDLKYLIENNKITFENEDQKLTEFASVGCREKNNFKIFNSKSKNEGDNLIAEAFYYKTIMEKGWDKISLTTFKNKNCLNEDKLSPFIQAYIGGYLEGRLEFEATNDFYNNMDYNINKVSWNTKIFRTMKNFFKDVDNYMLDNLGKFDEIFSTQEEKDYYYKIYIFFAQLHGYLRGHNHSVKLFNEKVEAKDKNYMKELSIGELLIIQADGEIPELIHNFNYKLNGKSFRLGQKNYFRNAFDVNEDDPVKVWKRLKWRSRCSAMIKLIKDDNENIKDLFSGHTTWTDYTEIYRVIKHYSMELNDYAGNLIKADTIFSSYPGCLSSTDDFYLTNNNLMVTETTLDIIDMSLYDNVKEVNKYIPNFMRVNSATFFSKSGEEWVNNFKFYNSGTYSSQWMIVDYKRFESFKENKIKFEKVLYVLEQTPSSIISYDVSKYLLNNTYYASFNRAFFSETNQNLHMQLIKELYGDIFTFQGSARGKIFKKLEKTVYNLSDFRNVLRYNGYKHTREDFKDDPSKDNPGFGISARYDLESTRNLSGGVDCKITNSVLISKLSSIIISGPTIDNNPNLPIFDWKNQSSQLKHKGIPDRYEFGWYLASPDNLKNNSMNDKYIFE